ncbi:FKBP-type peptidylprolyl isomerase [Ruminococcus sp. 5_1_39BFAA]|uniref:FKBP-type peptidylprolyl isomerase n=1 Tax=Ruminococcus sp. 5_1_39BFAA TaxID=457412 RepID=UPI003561E968
MKKAMKRTTVAVLTGVLAAGMLSGCGEKKLDGTQTVATVNGTEIPMGVLSLYARQSQAQTEAMYMSFMGSAANIWDQTADTESGETYGEQAVKSCLEQIELMYIMKEKAADYGVEITEDEQNAMADAAAEFMADNDEETIEALSVTEDQVKELLELETYREKIRQPIYDEAAIEISEDEAQQSSFTYVSISTSGDDLTEDDIATRKEQAQAILDEMKEDPEADMGETAKAQDESYSALSGTFFTNESDDEDMTSSYPDEVIEALRTLGDGEVYPELIETDTSCYIVRLDETHDEDATQSKMESLKSTKESKYYTETTDKWLEDAEIKTEDKVLETLTITDNHSFSMKAAEVEEDTETAEDTDADAQEDEAETADEAEDTDAEGEEADTAGDTDAESEETDTAEENTDTEE